MTDDTEPKPRKTYEAPKLEVFGEVVTMTAGGSGMANEGNMVTNTMRRP